MESLPFDLAVPVDAAPVHPHHTPDPQSRSEPEGEALRRLLPPSHGLDQHSDENLSDCPIHHRWRESSCSIPLGYVLWLGRRGDIFLSTGTVLMSFDDSGVDGSVLVIHIIG